MMIVFSQDFGSEDPFKDALLTAVAMADQDVLSFCPHIGLAEGRVTVGYVGTPLRYNCSVFGRPVSTAARCCSMRSEKHMKSIFLPAATWGDKKLLDYLKPRKLSHPELGEIEDSVNWEVASPTTVEVKNMPNLEVIEIHSNLMHMPTLGAEDRARMAFEGLKKDGSYRPRRYPFEPQYKRANKAAAPNGGPATTAGSSGVMQGPPSVS